uniref:Uncharacterized protein n=1 Tax=Arundo donax TaxID=35708 RepID=A0A0A9FQI4_ARUDO
MRCPFALIVFTAVNLLCFSQDYASSNDASLLCKT